MSKFAIRLSTLAMCATALTVVPMVTPAKAETSSAKHLKKHKREIQRSPGFTDHWSARQAWLNVRSFGQGGSSCFRAIDCAKWPPSIDEDPDRKVGDGP